MLEMQLVFFFYLKVSESVLRQTTVYFVPPGLERDGFLQRKIKQLHFLSAVQKKPLLLLFVAFG